MNQAYDYQFDPYPSRRKIAEMKAFLRGVYWERDVWDLKDPFFNEYRNSTADSTERRVVFSEFSDLFRLELKYYFAMRLSKRTLHMHTIHQDYRFAISLYLRFLSKFYPELRSFSEVKVNELQTQWLEHIERKGYNTSRSAYRAQISRLHLFFLDFYDIRDEFEKDIWDCRKIPGVIIPVNSTTYRINFTIVPPPFRELARRYIKLRIATQSSSQARTELNSIAIFLKFVAEKEPRWISLKALSRRHVEDFLVSYLNIHGARTRSVLNKLIFIRHFLQRIQQFGYPDAPLTPAPSLLYFEDIPRAVEPLSASDRIRYIPEGVMFQLREHLEHLAPSEYIPVVILLMASGWRGSDVLSLKYDTCLEYTAQGWYLRGDIPKVRVMNHRIPITDEVKSVVETVAEIAKSKSTAANNPLRLLFNRYSGKRMGKSLTNLQISMALNRLAEKCNITDDQGNIYHFTVHSFRHTKGVELINNGMSLVHVQKWMAHMFPEMTLVYAKVLDTTLRKSWEHAVENGLFRITNEGRIRKIDISAIVDEDLIEWEYIRHNLDAVRMPLGFCMKPKKQNCFTQLNPCLTCRNLCTTPDFLPQYEIEIQETKALIERGKAQGREIWVEKNRHLLERYEEVIAVLRTGHTRHTAGKKGREYIGEERTDAK
jgi:integrase